MPTASGISELAQEVGLDPAAANRVIQFLLEEHHADYEGKGPGKVVFLTHPGATLEMWAGSGRSPGPSSVKRNGAFIRLR